MRMARAVPAAPVAAAPEAAVTRGEPEVRRRRVRAASLHQVVKSVFKMNERVILRDVPKEAPPEAAKASVKKGGAK